MSGSGPVVIAPGGPTSVGGGSPVADGGQPVSAVEPGPGAETTLPGPDQPFDEVLSEQIADTVRAGVRPAPLSSCHRPSGKSPGAVPRPEPGVLSWRGDVDEKDEKEEKEEEVQGAGRPVPARGAAAAPPPLPSPTGLSSTEAPGDAGTPSGSLTQDRLTVGAVGPEPDAAAGGASTPPVATATRAAQGDEAGDEAASSGGSGSSGSDTVPSGTDLLPGGAWGADFPVSGPLPEAGTTDRPFVTATPTPGKAESVAPSPATFPRSTPGEDSTSLVPEDAGPARAQGSAAPLSIAPAAPISAAVAGRTTSLAGRASSLLSTVVSAPGTGAASSLGATGAAARGGAGAATEELSPASEQEVGTLDAGALVESISRPLSAGDGTYSVMVAMHPPDLGHLQATLSLDGNDLQVSITPQTTSGHEALARSIDTLRDGLARGGVQVNVTLRDPGSPPRGDSRDEQTLPSTGGSEGADDPTAPAGPVLVTGQIHLVL